LNASIAVLRELRAAVLERGQIVGPRRSGRARDGEERGARRLERKLR
jgi:hypothetical protein